jgi:hypothetical protein
MRVRISAHPLAGLLGPLALGPLHFEDAQESISRKHGKLAKRHARRIARRLDPLPWRRLAKKGVARDTGLTAKINSFFISPIRFS